MMIKKKKICIFCQGNTTPSIFPQKTKTTIEELYSLSRLSVQISQKHFSKINVAKCQTGGYFNTITSPRKSIYCQHAKLFNLKLLLFSAPYSCFPFHNFLIDLVFTSNLPSSTDIPCETEKPPVKLVMARSGAT